MPENDVKNYVKLDDFAFGYQCYAYVDVNKYLMDDLICKYKIKVKLSKKELYNKTNDYCIILVKVKKKHIDLFLKACEELYTCMEAAGYDDYPDMCKHIQEVLNKED